MKVSRKLVLALLATGLVSIASPTPAHHSFAMFDQTKMLQLSNVTVTRFIWSNPHSLVVVHSGDKQYTLECSSPNLMTHQGWKFNSLKPGDQISVTYYPLRDGKPGGMLKIVMLPDGRKLSAW